MVKDLIQEYQTAMFPLSDKINVKLLDSCYHRCMHTEGPVTIMLDDNIRKWEGMT